jgi:integrase
VTVVPPTLSAEVAVKIVWSELHCDPARCGFFNQPVSIPTPDCPAGSVVGDAVWFFPEEITAERTPHSRRITWNIKIAGGSLTDPQHRNLLIFAKRYALARISVPQTGTIDLSTVKASVYVILRLVRFIAEVTTPLGRPDIASLTIADATKLIDGESAKWKHRGPAFRLYLAFITELQDYGKRGLTAQVFSEKTYEYIVGRLSDNIDPVIINKSASKWSARNTVPVPDGYCLTIMDMCDFFCQKLAPTIIKHVATYANYRNEERKISSDRRVRTSEFASLRYQKFAALERWPVAALPFVYDGQYPPRSWSELVPLLQSLQMLVWQMVAIFTGAHEHELLLLSPGGLKREKKNLNSVRFKTSASLGGEPFTWPIPGSVADAIEVQIELCRAAGFDGVWFASQKWDRMISGVPVQLKAFAERHRLTHLLGDDPVIATRRFRPQLARLLILGPDGYARLVKRALGHDSIATTLAYIRMNRYIALELARRDATEAGNQAEATGIPVSEGELTVDRLAALLSELARKGRRLSIVGPGVYCDHVDGEDADVSGFDNEQVHLAAFSFAVDKLTSAAVRGQPALYAWFLEQAKTIGGKFDAEDAYQPPTTRHGRLSSMVLGKEKPLAP